MHEKIGKAKNSRRKGWRALRRKGWSTITSAIEVESLVERGMYGSFFQFPQMIEIHSQP